MASWLLLVLVVVLVASACNAVPISGAPASARYSQRELILGRTSTRFAGSFCWMSDRAIATGLQKTDPDGCVGALHPGVRSCLGGGLTGRTEVD